MTFSFEEPTVTGDNFLALMENNALHHAAVGTAFQSDGALPHFSHVHAFLDRQFLIIGQEEGNPFPGPLLLQNLPPLDFFFWRFVNCIVYCEKVQNVKEMHNRIIRAEECITNEIFASTW